MPPPVRRFVAVLLSLVALLAIAAPAGAFTNGRARPSDLAPIYIPQNTAFLAKGGPAAAMNTMRLCAVRDGVDLYPSASSWTPAATAYRTYAAQLTLWNRYKAGTGALAAVPGTSNHGLGHAVDLGLIGMRSWVDRHGRAFGWAKVEAFSEWWHVNYVGGFHRPDPGTSLRFPNLRVGSGGQCQAPAVREVQRRLGLKEDGEYGKATRKRVKQFQRKYHLPVDGRVGSVTWLQLRKVGRDLAPHRDPRTVGNNLPGQTAPAAGQDVRADQGLLNAKFVELHHPGWRIKVDGVTSPAFTRAVKRFQRLRHLKATGRVDDRTYAELIKKVVPDTPRLAVSIEATNLVADFEGERLCPYRDVVGVWTVGYGHTQGVGPRSRCLSHAEAIALLHRDLDAFGKGVAKLAPKDATDRQFNAVNSLAFNVGLGAVSQSTLVREWRANHDANAAAQFKRWNRAGGRPLPGLTRRRRVECDLFVRGSSRSVQRARPCR